MRPSVLLAAFSLLILPCPQAPAQPAHDQAPRDQPAQREHHFAGTRLPDVKVERDVVYGKAGDRSMKLDVYLPDRPAGEHADDAKGAAPQPLPVIIWIHGGGWELGTKDGCPAAVLVPHGYAAVSISYRFSQVAPYPAQIHDCKGAVRWVRAHAKEYNLDPDRIGVWGASAGGHLAALLGTSAGVKELEGDIGDNDGVSSRVQAVCDWFGPTDIIRLCRMEDVEGAGKPDAPPATPAPPDDKKPARRHPTPPIISKLLGGDLPDKADVARLANPITFVDKTDAPFLIMHGDADTLVPLEQSQLLEKALKDTGVPVKLHIVKGSGHGFWSQELLDEVREFFDENLKKASDSAKK